MSSEVPLDRVSRFGDLSGHRCIAYRFVSTGALYPWEFKINGRDIEFAPDPHLSANSMSLSVEAAARGIGLAFTTEKLAAAYLAEGRLVRVLESLCQASSRCTSIIRAAG